MPNGLKVEGFEDSQFIIDEIWINKIYDDHIQIRSGMTVLDVGANQGFFSLYAASKGAKVYAYEPCEENHAILNRNIELSSFYNLIYPYSEALGEAESTVTLYVPDSEAYVSNGMVTLKENIVARLETIGASVVNHREVRQISLVKALERIKEESVDLLKIDCEGSEYDILLGVTREVMSRVQAIVMETHDAYKPEDLYRKIKELGFQVTYYEKPQGVFRNGFLCAINGNAEKRRAPVALFKSPAWIYQGSTCTLDASRSFSALGKSCGLTYKWSINGSSFGLGQQKELFMADRVGKLKIMLTVQDEGGVDHCEAHLACLPVDYHSCLADKVVTDMRNRFYLFEYTRIKIPVEMLPNNYVEDKIVIDMFAKNGKSFSGGRIRFLSDEYELRGGRTRVEFYQMHFNTDLIFEVFLDSALLVEFIWWADSDETIDESKKLCLSYDGDF